MSIIKKEYLCVAGGWGELNFLFLLFYMRQKFLILVALILGGLAIHEAQAQNVIEKGVQIVNVGVGIERNVFPISASYDYGIVGNLFDDKSALTLGGMGGLVLGKNTRGFVVGPRLGLHYHFIPKLDTYLSVMLGYYAARGVGSINGVAVSTKYDGVFDWGLHLGARYMFTPSMGVFAEVGDGWAFANVGVSFRF